MTITRPLAAGGPTTGWSRPVVQVRKRNGSAEPVDVNKIVRASSRCCDGLCADVDAMRVATKTISGLYDGATTRELDQLSIQTAAALHRRGAAVLAKLAARLLADYIDKEVRDQEIHVVLAVDRRRPAPRASSTSACAASSTDQRAQAQRRDRRRARPRVRVLRPAHGLRPLPAEAPETRLVDRDAAAVLPAHRVRALATPCSEALELYRLFSSLEYLPSSPTLFNSGTRARAALELLPARLAARPARGHLPALHDVAMLSKFSGGIGLAYHRVRSRGSLIAAPTATPTASCRGCKTLDASVAAVNQGGKRKGACCVYLEPWHADIEEFLELRDNTGDEARRTHNLNLANWIPDLFMRRVEADGDWSLFDPKSVPELPDLYGEAFERAYVAAEAEGLAAHDGQGARPLRADDAHAGADRQRLDDVQGRRQPGVQPDGACRATSCTSRTCAPRSSRSRRRRDGGLQPRLDQPRRARDRRTAFDFDEARAHGAHRGAPARPRDRPQLLPDRRSRRASNLRWRPVGLGLMGLQDVFFQLRLPFDCRRGARAVDAASPRRSTSRALRALGRAGGREGRASRRSTRRARRAASCSSTRGA